MMEKLFSGINYACFKLHAPHKGYFKYFYMPSGLIERGCGFQ